MIFLCYYASEPGWFSNKCETFRLKKKKELRGRERFLTHPTRPAEPEILREDHRPVSLVNTEADTLNRPLENRTRQHIKDDAPQQAALFVESTEGSRENPPVVSRTRGSPHDRLSQLLQEQHLTKRDALVKALNKPGTGGTAPPQYPPSLKTPRQP